MNIQIIKPENEKLKKYINYYYILKQTNETKKITYLTFPNPYSIVSVLESADLRYAPNQMSVTHAPDAPLTSDLTLSYKKSILISYAGKVKEVSICFKPLGINAFIENSVKHNSEKVPFFPYDDYQQKMTEVLSAEKESEVLHLLETYLLSKLSDFDHPFLFKFVEDVSSNLSVPLAELATKYLVSQKTLIKHTQKYLARTPSHFKKSVRFHQALLKYLGADKKILSLTDISNMACFFDQAHMIKDFKSLTGYSPHRFFKLLSSQKGNLNWIFL